jgi:hypothetical protein
MRRTISWIAAVGVGVTLAAACGDDADVIDPRPLGGSGGSAGTNGLGTGGTRINIGGDAGLGGSAGQSGAAGSDADAGVDAAAGSAGDPDGGPLVPVDAGDAGPLISCGDADDCDDSNACTTQACVASFCQFTPVTAGAACGDTTVAECTAADTCSANGVCLANHQPDGTACSGGFCNLTGVCDCAIDRVTAVPFSQQWQTIGSSGGGSDVSIFDGSCQACDNDLDHVVVFQAPAAGTYVFSASSVGDAQIWVAESDCATLGAELGCDDGDVPPDGFDAQIQLQLEQGQTVTVGASEICEAEGGNGSISITLAEG